MNGSRRRCSARLQLTGRQSNLTAGSCIDVRLTLQTDDGAVVLVAYQGRGDAATGTSYSAPLFETGDERYAWLTRIQAVGKSTFDGTQLHYEMFELV